MSQFAKVEGKDVFRVISYRDNSYDIEDGTMKRLNTERLGSHDEAMAFIHKYSLDNGVKSMLYTLIERGFYEQC